MRKSLRILRHNERVLIAVDVLLRSRSAFMSVFLMAFMMSVSLRDSPIQFIEYSILRNVVIALVSVFFVRAFKNHTLAMWRLSTLFAIVQVLLIISFDSLHGATYVLALFSGLETACYWRPKMIFDAEEVDGNSRVRFKATSQICIEITKIVMPILLGFAIDDKGYRNAALFILLISVVQFIVTLLLRPQKKHRKASSAQLARVAAEVLSRKSLSRMLVLQFLRGVLTAGGIYILVSTISLNQAAASGAERGVATALASVVAIVLLFIYRKFSNNLRAQRLILTSLIPAVLLLPLITLIFPDDKYIAMLFYVLATAIASSLIDGTVVMARIGDILCRHVKKPDDRMVVEVIGELALVLGRVISLCLLLAVTHLGGFMGQLIICAVFAVLIIPMLRLALPSKAYCSSKLCRELSSDNLTKEDF